MSAIAGANSLTFDEQRTLPAASGFADFVTRNAQLAYRVAYARLRHAADAEDAVQEAFLKLMAKDRWQGAENERAFVARVVWRAAGDLRDGVARRDQRNETSGEVLLALVPSPAPSPEQQTVRAAQHAQLHRLIDTLPAALREPLVLSTLEELGSAEVAAVLGIPDGTVRRRVTEARALLREKWKQMEANRGHAR